VVAFAQLRCPARKKYAKVGHPPLVKGDGYSMTTTPHPGDVGVYTENGSLRTTDHSVSVLTTGANGVETVGSKGGITPYTVTTPAQGWSDPNDKLTYYTQHP
jgi:hypothetical protein